MFVGSGALVVRAGALGGRSDHPSAAGPLGAALAEMAADPRGVGLCADSELNLNRVRDRRGVGVAGTLTALVASGEPVLVVCADASGSGAGASFRPPRRPRPSARPR